MLFVLGYWPFNFTEQNNIAISPEGGAVVQRHGSAFTAASPDKLHGLGEFSVLLDLSTSSDGQSAFEKIFMSAFNQEEFNFLFGQWKEGFLPIIRTDQKGNGIKLGIDNALLPGARTRFLFTHDGKRMRLYQDGAVRNGREAGGSTFDGWSREYPLIVGSDASGRAQWKGTLYEVAIFDRALSPKEIGAVASSQWTVDSGGKEDKKPLIHYLFRPENTYEAEFRGERALAVRDLGKGEPADLFIPDRYTPYKRIYLGWDPDWTKRASEWEDVVVNVLGFLPFGALLFVQFMKKDHRLQATGYWKEEENPPRSPFVKGGGLGRAPFFQAGGKMTYRETVLAVMLAVLVGFVVSFAIEWLQAYLPSRDSSLRDLICNTVGTFVGAVSAAWVMRRYKVKGFVGTRAQG